MDIGADNKLIDVKVLKSSGFRDLDKSVINAMGLCQFEAETKNGKHIRSSMQNKFTWNLDSYRYHHKATLGIE